MNVKIIVVLMFFFSGIVSGQKKDILVGITYSEYGIIETKTYKHPSTILFEDDSQVDKEIRFYNKDGFVCLIAFLDKNGVLIRLKNGDLLTKSWRCTDPNKDPVFLSDLYPLNFVNRFNSLKDAEFSRAFQQTIGFYHERRNFMDVPHIIDFLKKHDSAWLKNEISYLESQKEIEEEVDNGDEIIMEFPKGCGSPRLSEYHSKLFRRLLVNKVSFSKKQRKRMHNQLLVSFKAYKNGKIYDITPITRLNKRQSKRIEKNIIQILNDFPVLYHGAARCHSFDIKGALLFNIE